MRGLWIVIASACGGSSLPSVDAPDTPVVPTPNPAREIVETRLAFDVSAMTATATVTFGPSSDGATVEVGDLVIETIQVAGTDIASTREGDKLHLGLPASDAATPVEFTYRWTPKTEFDGASAGGFTFLWPYFCGNLFPCHSDPADGTTFTLDLINVPDGVTAIFPSTIATEAPSYQVAWAIDAFQELSLGTTTAGTEVVISHRANELANAQEGGSNLLAVFDWLEETIGPYRFGTKVGTVSIRWPAGAFGGMEHHPRWHIAAGSLASQETNAHEAAHGWYGDGIRIACWEDFVLSEGTTTYLAGRALDVVAPPVGAETWAAYEAELATIPGTDPVWPQSCNTVDILQDNLFTNAPYIRGAFFYRALAGRLGADVVDQILAAFYTEHAGKAATMTDMLATIQQVGKYDATACAETWLRSTTRPTPGNCP
jgi:aminopeptidase N